jgi:hypothetical protein
MNSEILEVENSSAISKISLNYEENIVAVAYTSNPEKFYDFLCEDVISVRDKLKSAESMGKCVSELKKEGTLQGMK